MKQVPSVEAVKEYVRIHASPTWQPDLAYVLNEIVFDAGCIWTAKQAVPKGNQPSLDSNNTYWDLTSGSGSAASKYLFADPLIKKGMPLALKNGKLYRAAYDDDTLVEVVGFALSDYVADVEKYAQKIGLMKVLPPLMRTHSIGDDEALYIGFQNSILDQKGNSLGVVSGTSSYFVSSTYKDYILASTASFPMIFSLASSQMSAIAGAATGTSMAMEVDFGFSGSATDVNIFEAVFADASANTYSFKVLLTNGNLCLSIFKNAAAATVIPLLPIGTLNHKVVSLIVDPINRKAEVHLDLDQSASINFADYASIFSGVAFSSVSSIKITADASISFKTAISQFVGVYGASWSTLQSEILRLGMGYFHSVPVFLGSAGTIQYRGDIIDEGNYRVFMGYFKDSSSFDIQLNEAVRQTYMSSDIFEDTEEVGTIKFLTSGNLPDGYVRPNGSALPNEAYPTLYNKYAALGFPWGKNDAQNTFNIPDYPDPFLAIKLRPSFRRMPDAVPDFADKAFVLSKLGSAGGAADGNIGFNLSNRQFETDISGYALYKNSINTTTPDTGTGGAPSVLSTSLFSSAILALSGNNSLMLSKSSSSAQGEGLSAAFTIDRGARTQPASITFFYETLNSAYQDGDLALFLYDVDNANFIPLSVSALPATYGSPSQFLATFIPTLSSKNYRLIWHCATTNATAWTVKLDNIQIGNKQIVQGAAISDGIVWTPATKITNLPGSWSLSSRRYRIGSTLSFRLLYLVSGAATGNLSISLTALLSELGLTSANNFLSVNVSCYQGATSKYIPAQWSGAALRDNSSAILSVTLPFSWATGDGIEIVVRELDIDQWAGSGTVGLVQNYEEYASNETANGVSGQTYSTGSVDGPSGSLVPSVDTSNINLKTMYKVSFKNDIQTTDNISIEVSTDRIKWYSIYACIFGFVVPMQKQGAAYYGIGYDPNDSKSVQVTFGGGGSVSTNLNYAQAGYAWSNLRSIGLYYRVRKTSAGKPGQTLPLVSADVVYTSVTTTASGAIPFSAIEEDTNSCLTLATGRFTCSTPGRYLVTGFMSKTSTSNSLTLFKNGVLKRYLCAFPTLSAPFGFSTTVRLSAGDYIDIRLDGVGTVTGAAQFTLLGR